jgi:hypothetical protein
MSPGFSLCRCFSPFNPQSAIGSTRAQQAGRLNVAGLFVVPLFFAVVFRRSIRNPQSAIRNSL